MKVLMINSVCGIGSTGRICTDLAELLEKQGHQCKIAYGRENLPEKYQKYAVRIGNDFSVKLHGVKTRLLDKHGLGSKGATRKFIKYIQEYDPDIIHLHNLHGYYINIEILFDYLKNANKKVVWTLHDCWSFTGHCAHFDYAGCDKWQYQCRDCELMREYPKSFFDGSKRNFEIKKNAYSSLPNMTLVAPSKWLQQMTKKSFLKDNPIYVFPNGIDLNQFTHSTNSKFKSENGLQEKYMVLAVAGVWTKAKGIDYVNQLSEQLPANYQVVAVGKLSPGEVFSNKVLHVLATDSIDKLREMYSAADVFVNPTLQETQGLTTVEALACGTPVVVFNSGGAGEAVDSSCGFVVPRGDYDSLQRGVIDACEKRCFSIELCQSVAKMYDKNECYGRYLKLYEELLEEKHDEP